MERRYRAQVIGQTEEISSLYLLEDDLSALDSLELVLLFPEVTPLLDLLLL